MRPVLVISMVLFMMPSRLRTRHQARRHAVGEVTYGKTNEEVTEPSRRERNEDDERAGFETDEVASFRPPRRERVPHGPRNDARRYRRAFRELGHLTQQ